MLKMIKARGSLWIWDVWKFQSVPESEMDQMRETGRVSESFSWTTEDKNYPEFKTDLLEKQN